MELYEDKYKLRCKELKEQGLALEELNNFSNFEDVLTKDEFKLCLNKKHNRANKRYRTKDKILTLYRLAMVLKRKYDVKVIFGTQTLSNKTLDLKESTYIKKFDIWLKQHFDYVIINKDFGSKTEREHYHFIGLTTEEIEKTGKKSYKGYDLYELVKKDAKIGFEPDLELIDDRFEDISKITNYLLKLNNHSNKASTSSRVRVLKTPRAELAILVNNLDYKKADKKARKSFQEKLKNATYDELNKMSSSDKELSIDEFVSFLDGKISYSEL